MPTTYTEQELQAMSIEQLIAIYIEMRLKSTRMNAYFVAKNWLIEDILNGEGK